MRRHQPSATARGRATRVVLAAPSAGLGGGVERYVSGVEAALEACGVPFERLNLKMVGDSPPSVLRKSSFAREVRAAMRVSAGPTRLMLAHVGLLPLALAVRRLPNYTGTTVHYHGYEVWQGRRVPGEILTKYADVRAVTGSSFTSGALHRAVNATVVAPPLPHTWFTTLVAAAASSGARDAEAPLRLLSVFRLSDWQDKGLPTIVEAATTLGSPVSLTVVGSGETPPGLRDLVARTPWLELQANLSDTELAAEFARADVYVGATKTRTGKKAFGEGFGLTLVEAQLAGTAVVAPAYGGSLDTFQPGLTGLAPVDESVEALAHCLSTLAGNRHGLAVMSAAAHEWSRTRFDPQRSARQLVEAIL